MIATRQFSKKERWYVRLLSLNATKRSAVSLRVCMDANDASEKVPILVRFLADDSCERVHSSVIRTITNITSGADDQAVEAINCPNLLPILKRLYESSPQKRSIRRDICFLLSNVAAGTFAKRLSFQSPVNRYPRQKRPFRYKC